MAGLAMPLILSTIFDQLPSSVAWAPVPVSASTNANSAVSSAAAPQRLRLDVEVGTLRGSSRAQEEVAWSWAQATRAFLGVLAACAVVVGGTPRAVRAEDSGVNMYFGQGCFWHVQHEFIKSEAKLGRTPDNFTALSGYAGGKQVGDKGIVCYHNMAFAPDYGQMGHTEVVNVSVPADKIGDFAKEYFDAAVKYPFGRADPQDRGTEYRSAIGLPGGMDGPLFKQVEAANNGRLELLKGEGNDSDTVFTKKVWIYDSNKFPFHQGEVYHQFHDDMMERYSQSYHKIKDGMVKAGKLQEVGCPEMGF